eukprot:3526332-Ditylum_brightwellii.AAC.1
MTAERQRERQRDDDYQIPPPDLPPRIGPDAVESKIDDDRETERQRETERDDDYQIPPPDLPPRIGPVAGL